MNRRELLAGAVGIGTVALTSGAVVEKRPNGVTSMVPIKAEGQSVAYDQLEDKYWAAQRHIDELYDELKN